MGAIADAAGRISNLIIGKPSLMGRHPARAWPEPVLCRSSGLEYPKMRVPYGPIIGLSAVAAALLLGAFIYVLVDERRFAPPRPDAAGPSAASFGHLGEPSPSEQRWLR